MAKRHAWSTVVDRPGFRIRAAAETLEILIYDIIGKTWDDEGVTAKDVYEALKNADASVVNVHINSAGGYVSDAIAIYNALHQNKARVEVWIDGMALSAASVVAMAGDTIRIAENGMMMIHDAWELAIGSADELRSVADRLEKYNEALVATYASRTGRDEDNIRDLMSAETWFTAEEAIDNGFADEIVAAKRMAAMAHPEEIDRLVTRCRNAPERLPDVVRPSVKSGVTKNRAMEACTMPNDDKHEEQVAKAAADAAAKAKADTEQVTNDRIAGLMAAFPNDPAFALSQIQAGHDVTQAKAAYADKLAEKLVLLEKENAEAVEKAQAAADAPGLNSAGGFDKTSGKAGIDGDDFIDKAKAISLAESIPLAQAKQQLAREEPGLYETYRETLRVTKTQK